MKKTILLLATLLTVIGNTSAFALVSYDQNNAFSRDQTLNNGSNNAEVIFTFTNITDNFVGSEASSYPILSLMLRGSNSFSDTLNLQVNNQTVATFSSKNPTYQFDAVTMGYLNSAINDKSVTFSLVRNSGTSALSSARLTGTVAPEPATMALVAAGLIGLPFARRLRKMIKP